ncbi:hypothetical protein [Actinacidiphila soli]|uniref:hypothetical protein n=1 Tax=Actinacidiphila soli TaxID=2487275 RepID=UPI000FCA99A3|nr:hypothetical protein [Actinacidiphila soli]
MDIQRQRVVPAFHPAAGGRGNRHRPLLRAHRRTHRPSGGTKAAALAAHLDALGISTKPRRLLLICDPIDDADAAHANEAFAVLHTGGLHHPAKFTAAGHPLADNLDQAVALGLRLAAELAPAWWDPAPGRSNRPTPERF